MEAESNYKVGDKVVIKSIGEVGTVIRVDKPQFNYLVKPDKKNFIMGTYYEDELQDINDTFIPDDFQLLETCEEGDPVMEGEDE
jgi:hypothetical protein